MKRKAHLVVAAAFVATLLLPVAGFAYASPVEEYGVTPEYTSRPLYITKVEKYWQADGNKTLTSGSYGQLTVSRSSNMSPGNRIMVAAFRTEGAIYSGPVYISRTGMTVRYVTNGTGRNLTIAPKVCAESDTITGVQGTWSYYER